MPPDIRTALQQAAERFTALPEATPRLDAEVLLSHVLGRDRSYLLTWPERTLTSQQQAAFERLAARRAAGEPVAHLTGEREFWSLPFKVTADTLIPRPETERLVELALAHMLPAAAGHAADLGTGSGAIALVLARERPGWSVLASDRSEAALAVACDNGQRLQVRNVEFRIGHWCEALGDRRFDVMVSNPPYVAAGDPHLTRGDVRFEPSAALVAGADGMDDIRCLARCSLNHLKPGGWLLFEHGPEQGPASRRLLIELGYQAVATHRDFAGRERVSEGRAPAA